MYVSHQSPPEGVSIRLKLFIIFFFCQINQETGQNETQEANVPGCDEFLWVRDSSERHRGREAGSERQRQSQTQTGVPPCCERRLLIQAVSRSLLCGPYESS